MILTVEALLGAVEDDARQDAFGFLSGVATREIVSLALDGVPNSVLAPGLVDVAKSPLAHGHLPGWRNSCAKYADLASTSITGRTLSGSRMSAAERKPEANARKRACWLAQGWRNSHRPSGQTRRRG